MAFNLALTTAAGVASKNYLDEIRLRQRRKYEADFYRQQQRDQETAFAKRFDIQRKAQKEDWLTQQDYLRDPLNQMPLNPLQKAELAEINRQTQLDEQYRQSVGGLQASVAGGVSPELAYQQAVGIQAQHPQQGAGLANLYAPPQPQPVDLRNDPKFQVLQGNFDAAVKTFQKIAEYGRPGQPAYDQAVSDVINSQNVLNQFVGVSTEIPTGQQFMGQQLPVSQTPEFIDTVDQDRLEGKSDDQIAFKIAYDMNVDIDTAKSWVKSVPVPGSPQTIMSRAMEIALQGIDPDSAWEQATLEAKTQEEQTKKQRQHQREIGRRALIEFGIF